MRNIPIYGLPSIPVVKIHKRVKTSVEWLRMFFFQPFPQVGLETHGVLRQRWPTPELHTHVTDETLSKCNLQLQSPLFDVLPAEIRNLIFHFATLPYDDPDPEFHYTATDFWYRPEHHARRKHSTALLLTCRRIWLETNSLPLRNAEPTFWFKENDRRPRWTHTNESYRKPFKFRQTPNDDRSEEIQFERILVSLTPLNRENLQRIRVFAQMYWLEQQCLSMMLMRACKGGAVLPPNFTVTIRHTDWWWWEHDARLRMKDEWIGLLLVSPYFKDVNVFTLELETLKHKREEMQTIVAQIRHKHRVTSHFVLDEKHEIPIMRWRGPIDIDGKRRNVYHSRYKFQEMEYEVVSLVWKRTNETEAE